MLTTNLKHINNKQEFEELISKNEKVMVCCGRMGPMCVPVYYAMENLKSSYPDVLFADMAFDIEDAAVIRNLPECSLFRGLPFTVYFANGKVVKATSSVQNKEQIKKILDEFLA